MTPLSIFGFILCGSVIVFSGSKLVKYGDAIADLTGLGRVWVGMILMAAVTSLPELMTGISSVVFVDAPNLAVGDVLGSCMFNLLILSFIDVRMNSSITALVKVTHLLTGLFGIILVAMVGLAIFMGDSLPMLGWVNTFSILLVMVYLIAVWLAHQYEQTNQISLTPPSVVSDGARKKLKSVMQAYLTNAAFVVAAAVFLPYFGEQIARSMGLSNTFFGTLFLAASTSLPELVVSFAAIRMGTFDLLVGNLLGSNIFNCFILALDDFFYIKGSLFSNIEAKHLQSVFIIILMTAVVGLGLLVKSSTKIWRLGIDTLIVLLLYIALMWSLFARS